MLSIAKAKWCFVGYQNYHVDGRTVLWRHDVDISVHRALRLAEIEHEEGVASTFFLMLHSSFYNLLEVETACKVASILELGHSIGLHFDPSFYGDRISSKEQMVDFLEREKTILESCFDVKVHAFSWHNPTVGEWLSMDNNYYSGMVNAYGASLRHQYTYISDSNGIWRHGRLMDILNNCKDEKLHVLTHPEWWQKSPMSPRERVFRSVKARADNTLYGYDKILAENGRENFSGPADNIKFLRKLDADHYQLCDYLWNSRMLRSLFIELYRLHERQIKQLCKVLFSKVWRVTVYDVDLFFESDTLRVEGWKLFQVVFGISWVEASGCSEEEHKVWLKVRDQIFYESNVISSDKIEEGCIYLCGIIKNVAGWGGAQEAIEYDGISSPYKLDVVGGEVDSLLSKKWSELKSQLQEIQND